MSVLSQDLDFILFRVEVRSYFSFLLILVDLLTITVNSAREGALIFFGGNKMICIVLYCIVLYCIVLTFFTQYEYFPIILIELMYIDEKLR